MNNIRRTALGLAAVSVASIGSLSVVDVEKRRQVEEAVDWAKFCGESIIRMARFNGTLALIIGDYYYHLNVRDKNNRKDINTLLEQIKETTESKDRLKFSSNWEKEVKKLLSSVSSSSASEDIQISRQHLIREQTQHLSKLISRLDSIYSENAMSFHEVHLRNAQRLFGVCEKNGGLFVKMGQMIVMMDYLVPEEYQTVLSPLLNQTPATQSRAALDQIFRKDFGLGLSDAFDSFQEKPIASASLSSVYEAWKDGRRFAVKIHHKNLTEKIK